MEEITDGNEIQAPKRPGTLTLLCVLTFIYSGIGILAAIFTPLFADSMVEFMLSNPAYDEATMSETIKVLQAGWGYYMLTLVLTLGSLTGAILIWKLKKNGFHFYAFSNLALLFIPSLVLGLAISWAAIFITAAFIGMYALHLKYMK